MIFGLSGGLIKDSTNIAEIKKPGRTGLFYK